MGETAGSLQIERFGETTAITSSGTGFSSASEYCRSWSKAAFEVRSLSLVLPSEVVAFPDVRPAVAASVAVAGTSPRANVINSVEEQPASTRSNASASRRSMVSSYRCRTREHPGREPAAVLRRQPLGRVAVDLLVAVHARAPPA